MVNETPLNTWLLTLIAVCNMMAPVFWLMVKRDIKQLEVNTNSKMDAFLKLKGESEHAKGVLQGEGDSTERLRQVAVRIPEKPVPVTDDRVAAAAEKTATATEKIADAAVRSADVIEKKGE